jgi:small acid-soluble spore protein N (minor)
LQFFLFICQLLRLKLPSILEMILNRGGISMGNPKRHSKPYTPNHIGTQPRAAGGNKGKQMQDKSGKHAQVIQTKGE